LLQLQLNVALKRLASAVQLRPWPPYFSMTYAFPTVTFCAQLRTKRYEKSLLLHQIRQPSHRSTLRLGNELLVNVQLVLARECRI